jgi:hypothetical protein
MSLIADSTDYEPMMMEGVQVGEARWLRTEGSHGNQHEACLWRTDAPARYEYLFTGDESFQVLEAPGASNSPPRQCSLARQRASAAPRLAVAVDDGQFRSSSRAGVSGSTSETPA